ncbi:MAG: hypothetical protein EBS31_05435 [Burkholderiaceae bacterium]|nr:hypothetical protein [Burkholderiaceae bacterium]
MVKVSYVPCPNCGNARSALASSCPFCGAAELPDGTKKVAGIFTFNLEIGLPSVAQARARLLQKLEQIDQTGVQFVKVIHGYGSSGRGGAIKDALLADLQAGFYQTVENYYRGDDLLPGYSTYALCIKQYPQLKAHLSKDIYGNPGITLLVLSP